MKYDLTRACEIEINYLAEFKKLTGIEVNDIDLTFSGELDKYKEMMVNSASLVMNLSYCDEFAEIIRKQKIGTVEDVTEVIEKAYTAGIRKLNPRIIYHPHHKILEMTAARFLASLWCEINYPQAFFQSMINVDARRCDPHGNVCLGKSDYDILLGGRETIENELNLYVAKHGKEGAPYIWLYTSLKALDSGSYYTCSPEDDSPLAIHLEEHYKC